jgi:primosomal protein N' (replication factor Y) (superfamily II helicase)
MAGLFDNPPELADQTPRTDARRVRVAVNANVWGSYDYLWPATLGQPVRGLRVRVSFGPGGRKTLGFVCQVDPPPTEHKLKAVSEKIDEEPQLDDNLWRLAEWIARYYLTPLGMVLGAMVPSAVGKHAPKTQVVAWLADDQADWPDGLGSKQRAVLDELRQARKQGIEPLPVEQLRANSGASRDTISRLRQRELIRTEARQVTLDDVRDEVEPDPFDLNQHQKQRPEDPGGGLAGR